MVEQTRRPKIILVWGVHPNESAVTEYLAKALKPLLEARGIDVEVIPFPEELTYLHINAKSIASRLDTNWNNARQFILNLSSLNSNSTIIELHTTREDQFKMAGIEFRKPRFWQMGRDYSRISIMSPLLSIHKARTNNQLRNCFTFEMPAKYKPSNKWQLFVNDGKTSYDDRDAPYFLFDADLTTTKTANWLSQKIIGKISHYFDRLAKTRAGIYKYPKRQPYRSKEELGRLKEEKLRRLKLLRERMRPR